MWRNLLMGWLAGPTTSSPVTTAISQTMNFLSATFLFMYPTLMEEPIVLLNSSIRLLIEDILQFRLQSEAAGTLV